MARLAKAGQVIHHAFLRYVRGEITLAELARTIRTMRDNESP